MQSWEEFFWAMTLQIHKEMVTLKYKGVMVQAQEISLHHSCSIFTPESLASIWTWTFGHVSFLLIGESVRDKWYVLSSCRVQFVNWRSM